MVIDLIFKGEMRVMVFGEDYENGVLIYGFTSLEEVEFEGRNILPLLGKPQTPFIEKPNTSYLETLDLHLKAVSDIGYYELPVTISDFEDENFPDWAMCHLSCDTHRSFEGAGTLFMAQEIGLSNSIYHLCSPEENIMEILDLAEIDRGWSECKDYFPNELPQPEMRNADKMTTLVAGDIDINVPMGFAQELKHFLNHFGIQPLWMAMITEFDDRNDGCLLLLMEIEPNAIINTRHYKNLERRLARRTIKKYNIDFDIRYDIDQ